jgi:hypothetical protein
MKYQGTIAVSAISGRNSGSKMSKNLVGSKFKKPTNPRSAAQQTVRSAFTTNTKGWASLTDAQRSGFTALASGLHRSDRFGNKYTQKGKQLYSQLNNNLAQAGEAAISTAPSSTLVTAPLTAAFGSNTNAAQTIAFTASPVPANTSFIIEMTKPLSAGYSKVTKSMYRVVAIEAAAATSPANTFAAYSAIFGAPITGKKIFGQIVAVNTLTGFKSTPVAFVGTTA